MAKVAQQREQRESARGLDLEDSVLLAVHQSCPTASAQEVAELLDGYRKDGKRNPAGYVITAARKGQLTKDLEALRASRRLAEEAAALDELRQGAECPHGLRGGAEPHPRTGEPVCALCRAEARAAGVTPALVRPVSPDGSEDRMEAGQPNAQIVSLADVDPEPVEWLWDEHLPLGKLVVLDGDPGVGKSTVSLDIAARVSTGSPMPDGSAGAKGAVLILSAEDGVADTIRPRLDAAHGDPNQVIAMTGITYPGSDGELLSRPVRIPGDLPAIEETVCDRGVVLVIVDVLMAYLGGDVNSHHDQDIRRALHPLAAMAERRGCCVLVLRHLNKTTGTAAIYRGGGSIGIIGAARAGFICGTDPEDNTRRVFAPVKCNLSVEPSALAYQLVTDELRGCVSIRWLGETALKPWELLSEQSDGDQRSERDEAAEWLRGYLTDNGGEANAGDVIRAALKELGIPQRTLQRARKRAGVVSVKPGPKVPWLWRLDLGDGVPDRVQDPQRRPEDAKGAQSPDPGALGAFEAPLDQPYTLPETLSQPDETAAADPVTTIAEYVSRFPGCTARDLRHSGAGTATKITNARETALARGLIYIRREGRALRHYPGSGASETPEE